MFDLDRWTEIAVTLRSNRLRTFLTAAGVFWGMFMLVVMLGFGDGLERGIKRSMSGFATNSVYVATTTRMPPHSPSCRESSSSRLGTSSAGTAGGPTSSGATRPGTTR
ncbi:MAG: ABC transporter permease [Deltaproteobacteria bacterium]|nr:ABC transporter permease [Deltaproteobacteria bacterium]